VPPVSWSVLLSSASLRINKKRNMESTRKAARVAGFWYFVSSLPAPFAVIYVPSVFIVMEGPH